MNENIIEIPRKSEIVKESKEHSFEEGIPLIMESIESLLSEKDLVVVAVAGSHNNDVNVGKTTITGKIEWTCREKNIPVISMNSVSSISQFTKYQLEADGRNCRSNKGVIILGAMSSPSDIEDPEKIEEYRSYKNKSVEYEARKYGLEVSNIDIRVFVYRPDRKLPTKGDQQHADFIIRNEKAKDINPRIK